MSKLLKAFGQAYIYFIYIQRKKMKYENREQKPLELVAKSLDLDFR